LSCKCCQFLESDVPTALCWRWSTKQQIYADIQHLFKSVTCIHHGTFKHVYYCPRTHNHVTVSEICANIIDLRYCTCNTVQYRLVLKSAIKNLGSKFVINLHYRLHHIWSLLLHYLVNYQVLLGRPMQLHHRLIGLFVAETYTTWVVRHWYVLTSSDTF